jgi:hypothetical protein
VPRPLKGDDLVRLDPLPVEVEEPPFLQVVEPLGIPVEFYGSLLPISPVAALPPPLSGGVPEPVIV